jgi:CRISPR-associated protein Cmr1
VPRADQIPVCPGVPSNRSTRLVSRDYSIRLITPLFGGGVEAGQPDPSFPIRGSSIRGQLQFWWRATCGARFSTRNELFNRHKEVWGTTERASPVTVEVRDVQSPSARACAKYTWNQQARHGQGGSQLSWEPPFKDTELPYVLFPFQGQASRTQAPDAKPEECPALFIENSSFTLRVRFPEVIQQDVHTAVWAWVNFGGLGARTRRGCGALFSPELAPESFSNLQEWVRAVAGLVPAVQREWPTFPSDFLSNTEVQTPMEVWKRLASFWKYFRQGEGFARNPRTLPYRPGRSRYPEPETIREVSGSGANRAQSGHSRLSHIPADAFPRAELGLPIVFHFQGRGEPPGSSHVPDPTLYPESAPDGTPRDRMASPLILKPLALANGKAVPLIIWQNVPRLSGIDLRQGSTSLPLPSTVVVQSPRLATYRDSPLSASTTGSALDAFVALALASGFQKVTR